MNGTMVRNDITISLISCQFETSTVLILERLFVFIIETELNLKRKHPSFYKMYQVWKSFVASHFASENDDVF